MPRYKLIIEYNGMCFYGWQRQESVLSVQGAIENAFLKLTGVNLLVEGAGRTDRGVHAVGQVAHVDLLKEWDSFKLQEGLNHFLSHVSILEVHPVDNHFHARFSACERHYCYRIINRPAPSVLEYERAWHIKKPLNVAKMQEAAHFFIGFHNFSAFRSSACQAQNPCRTVTDIFVEQQGIHIEITIRAPSFLHNQVRIMVGTLKKIGEEKMPIEMIAAALQSGERAHSGPTAPSYGLYLTKVCYEKDKVHNSVRL